MRKGKEEKSNGRERATKGKRKRFTVPLMAFFLLGVIFLWAYVGIKICTLHGENM